jgi:uroporphyrinogen decarboxylase
MRALNGEILSPPPIWLMRQAGRYLPEYRKIRAEAGSFLDLCYSPEFAVEVTHQPIRRFNLDAAILFSDILVVPHALGQAVTFKEGEGPVLTPICSAMDLDRLSTSTLLEHLAPVFKILTDLSQTLPSTCSLIGFSGAPWTLATYMIEGGSSKDFVQTKRMMWEQPALFSRLITLLTDAIKIYLSAQIEAGAEILQLFDSWAGALPEIEFKRWVIQPMCEIVETLRAKYPKIKIIGFPKGAGILYLDYVKATKVDGISLDFTVPLQWAADVLQPLATLQGNIDPILVAAGGEALDLACDRLRKVWGGGAYIANLGHGIIPSTPPDNVLRLVNRLRS